MWWWQDKLVFVRKVGFLAGKVSFGEKKMFWREKLVQWIHDQWILSPQGVWGGGVVVNINSSLSI